MNKFVLSIALAFLAGAGYGQQVSSSGNPSIVLSATGRTGGSSAEGKTLEVACNWLNLLQIQLHGDNHGKEGGAWIQKVTQIKLMILDKKKAADVEQWDKLVHELQGQRYEELLSVRKGQDRVRLMVRDGDGVKELAFLAGDSNGGLYIQFAGKFTDHDLEQMQSSLKE